MLEGLEKSYLESFEKPKTKSIVEAPACIYEGINIPPLIINYPNS